MAQLEGESKAGYRRVRIEGSLESPTGYTVTVRDLATGELIPWVKRVDITLDPGGLNIATLTHCLAIEKGDLPSGGIVVGKDGQPVTYQEQTLHPELAITAYMANDEEERST